MHAHIFLSHARSHARAHTHARIIHTLSPTLASPGDVPPLSEAQTKAARAALSGWDTKEKLARERAEALNNFEAYMCAAAAAAAAACSLPVHVHDA